MDNIIAYPGLERGTNLVLFTAYGIFSGQFSGAELIGTSPWLTLEDVKVFPHVGSCTAGEVTCAPSLTVQLSQVISMTTGAVATQ